jgi:hypothetical protein
LEATLANITAQEILDHLQGIDHYSGPCDDDGSGESIVPYYEFSMRGDTYYLTAGGYLFRKAPDMEGVGGFYCGSLIDGVWHPKEDNPLGKDAPY